MYPNHARCEVNASSRHPFKMSLWLRKIWFNSLTHTTCVEANLESSEVPNLFMFEGGATKHAFHVGLSRFCQLHTFCWLLPVAKGGRDGFAPTF